MNLNLLDEPDDGWAGSDPNDPDTFEDEEDDSSEQEQEEEEKEEDDASCY